MMIPTPRLKAGIFVRALIRRVQVAGAAAFVVRMGSEEAGAVILKISRLDGTCLLLNQAVLRITGISGDRSGRGASSGRVGLCLRSYKARYNRGFLTTAHH